MISTGVCLTRSAQAVHIVGLSNAVNNEINLGDEYKSSNVRLRSLSYFFKTYSITSFKVKSLPAVPPIPLVPEYGIRI